MTNAITAILLFVVGFFIIQALPAAIDQSIETYRADNGINRAEIVARWKN